MGYPISRIRIIWWLSLGDVKEAIDCCKIRYKSLQSHKMALGLKVKKQQIKLKDKQYNLSIRTKVPKLGNEEQLKSLIPM